MRNYGYIIDKNLFNGQANDVQWDFDRYNENQTTTNYNGIETDRDLSGDPNIVIKGDGLAFSDWVSEFTPPII